MKKYVLRGLGTAGVAYAAMNMVYGGAEYADLGVTMVSADLLVKVVPAIMGVLLPLITAKWPLVGSLLSKLLGFFKSNPDSLENILKLLNQVEISAAKSGDAKSLAACQTLRTQTLARACPVMDGKPVGGPGLQ